MFAHGPQAPQALNYLSTQSLVSQERIRVVPSMSATYPSGPPLKDFAPISDPLEIIPDMEKRFALWIASELKLAVLEVNGFIIEPPSWIFEDHTSGGISLASKATHGLPIMIFWLGPAASLTG